MSNECSCCHLKDRVAKLEGILEGMKTSITLRHPDGGPSIVLSAHAGSAGIWVDDPETGSIATIQNVKNQGACVGIYGGKDAMGKRQRKAMDVAICYDKGPKGGGQIQFMENDNTYHRLDAKDVDNAVKL